MLAELPKIKFEDETKPGWIAVRDSAGRAQKPVIRCQCGVNTGIGLHHVHADGTVTKSFHHAAVDHFFHNGKRYGHVPGCGWHVFLKLKDYDLGDFPPEE